MPGSVWDRRIQWVDPVRLPAEKLRSASGPTNGRPTNLLEMHLGGAQIQTIGGGTDVNGQREIYVWKALRQMPGKNA